MKTFRQWVEAWSSKGPMSGLDNDIHRWLAQILLKKGIKDNPGYHYELVDASTISPGGTSAGEFGLTFFKQGLPPDVLEAIKVFVPKLFKKWGLNPYQDQYSKAIEDDARFLHYNVIHAQNDPTGERVRGGKHGTTDFGVGGNRWFTQGWEPSGATWKDMLSRRAKYKGRFQS